MLLHPMGPELPIFNFSTCGLRMCVQLYVLRATHALVQATVGVGTVIIVLHWHSLYKGGGCLMSHLPPSRSQYSVLVWYGMVWYGMVWYGMVWYGVVWCGVVWCGVVWCGVVWCGVVWCGVVWCGVVWYGMVWYGMVWYGMVWYGMVWYGTVW